MKDTDAHVTGADVPAAGAQGPLYRQIKDAMLSALAQGEWKQGDALPPEKVLASRFGVAIGTLRKAIDDMVADGILTRQQGRGTFVAAHKRNSHFFRYFRLQRKDGQKAYPTNALLTFRRIRASAAARDVLQLGPDEMVFEFSNLLSLHGDVVLVDSVVVPDSLFRGLTESQLKARPSTLYNFYQDAFEVNVIATEERLSVAHADLQHAVWLDVAPGFAVLEVHRVAYSYHQRPVEWRMSRINTTHYEYIGPHTGE